MGDNLEDGRAILGLVLPAPFHYLNQAALDETPRPPPRINPREPPAVSGFCGSIRSREVIIGPNSCQNGVEQFSEDIDICGLIHEPSLVLFRSAVRA